MSESRVRPGHYLAPNWATRTRGVLTVHDVAVYFALLSRVDTETRERWMSIADVAAEAHTSRSSAKRAIAHLKALGAIEVELRGEGKQQLPNLYRVPIFNDAPYAAALAGAESVQTEPRSVPPGPRVGSERTVGRSHLNEGSVPTGPQEGAPKGAPKGAVEGGAGETATAPSAVVALPASPGAPAPDTTVELSWGWRGLLNREQWDEYAPEYERVHGEPLRAENTKYYPGPESYAEALATLRNEQPRGPLRDAS